MGKADEILSLSKILCVELMFLNFCSEDLKTLNLYFCLCFMTVCTNLKIICLFVCFLVCLFLSLFPAASLKLIHKSALFDTKVNLRIPEFFLFSDTKIQNNFSLYLAFCNVLSLYQ